MSERKHIKMDLMILVRILKVCIALVFFRPLQLTNDKTSGPVVFFYPVATKKQRSP